MARILGLDLGSYSVKGLLLETSGRTTPPQVKTYAEAKRPDTADRADSLRQALRELFAANPLEADQVVISLPGQSLVTHPVSLPFTQQKQLEATLPSEVEAQLPFDLTEAVYDYQPTTVTDKKTDLIVGVLRRDELRDLLAVLAEVGVDPRVVTHPALAYQALLVQHPELLGQTGTVAILDVGHERTTLAIGVPGGPLEFARAFSFGGASLSRALATEFQTALPDAHAWKEEHGALASAVNGPDAERAAAAFTRGLQPLLREVRSTLKAFTARTRRAVERVYLCGGTARLAGLDEQLTRDLGIPCTRLALPDSGGVVAPEAGLVAAQAFALASRPTITGPRAPRFNLRRGEFASKGDLDFLKERAPRLAAYVGILLVLLIAGGIVRNTVLKRREAQVDEVVCEVTRRVLGSCEKNYDRALNMLQGTESPAAAIPRYSAVNLLAEVTSRVPREVPVTFDQIIVDLDRITLRGETENNRQIDQIRNALKGFRCFKEVNQGRVERTRDGQRVSFRLEVKVDCSGDAQAQG